MNEYGIKNKDCSYRIIVNKFSWKVNVCSKKEDDKNVIDEVIKDLRFDKYKVVGRIKSFNFSPTKSPVYKKGRPATLPVPHYVLFCSFWSHDKSEFPLKCAIYNSRYWCYISNFCQISWVHC